MYCCIQLGCIHRPARRRIQPSSRLSSAPAVVSPVPGRTADGLTGATARRRRASTSRSYAVVSRGTTSFPEVHPAGLTRWVTGLHECHCVQYPTKVRSVTVQRKPDITSWAFRASYCLLVDSTCDALECITHTRNIRSCRLPRLNL
jgi:hypothetical protein